jgi:hypothetical protein
MASDGGAACRRASAAAEESCRLIKKRARMSKAVTWEQVAEHTTEEQKVRCCLSHARLGGCGRESCALARVALALSSFAADRLCRGLGHVCAGLAGHRRQGIRCYRVPLRAPGWRRGHDGSHGSVLQFRLELTAQPHRIARAAAGIYILPGARPCVRQGRH